MDYDLKLQKARKFLDTQFDYHKLERDESRCRSSLDANELKFYLDGAIDDMFTDAELDRIAYGVKSNDALMIGEIVIQHILGKIHAYCKENNHREI